MTDQTAIEDVLSAWGLGPPAKLQRVAGELGINSQNLIVENSGEKFLLKTAPLTGRDALIEAIQIQDYCAAKGAPVPRVKKTTDNSFVRDSSDSCFALMDFVPAVEYSSIAEAHIWVAHALAQLHTVLRACPIVPVTKTGYDQLTDEEWRLIMNRLADSKVSEPEAVSFLDDVTVYFEFSKSFDQGWTSVSPWHLVHLDCHPDNMRFSESGLPTIIDFGHIQSAPRMLALSFCCHRFASFDSRAIIDFYAAYSATDPLDPGEVEHHWNFLILECSRRINFLLRLHFFENDSSWDFELRKHLKTLLQAELQLN